MQSLRYLSIEVAATPTGVAVGPGGELIHGSRDLPVGALRHVLAESPRLVEVNLAGSCLLDVWQSSPDPPATTRAHTGLSPVRRQPAQHRRTRPGPHGRATGPDPTSTSLQAGQPLQPVDGGRAHGGDFDVRSNRYETEFGGVPCRHLRYGGGTCRAAGIGRQC